MKRFLFCLIMTAFYSSANSQTNEEEMLHFAIEQYVVIHFDTASEQLLYIETLDGKGCCSYKYGGIRVILFDTRKEKYYFKKAIKNNKGLFYTLSIKHLTTDTIDFLFCECHVNKIGRYYHILMESGGDAGYFPFARFVYDDMEEKWIYCSVQELMKGVPFKIKKLNKATGTGLGENVMAN